MNHYNNIQASLLRFCSEFGAAQGLEPVYLDGHTDEASWPNGDFLGVGEVNIDIQETYSGQCMFGVSTANDTNLHRMGELVGALVEFFLPGGNIPAYDAQTGDVIGNIFILKGTRVGAPMPTKTQPIQPVAIRFETDLLST